MKLRTSISTVAITIVAVVSSYSYGADEVKNLSLPTENFIQRDNQLRPIQILNRRRTQMTLVLYAPVLAEMLNQGAEEADGWVATLVSKIARGPAPRELFNARRTCVTALFKTWQSRITNGTCEALREICRSRCPHRELHDFN